MCTLFQEAVCNVTIHIVCLRNHLSPSCIQRFSSLSWEKTFWITSLRVTGNGHANYWAFFGRAFKLIVGIGRHGHGCFQLRAGHRAVGIEIRYAHSSLRTATRSLVPVTCTIRNEATVSRKDFPLSTCKLPSWNNGFYNIYYNTIPQRGQIVIIF